VVDDIILNGLKLRMCRDKEKENNLTKLYPENLRTGPSPMKT
jgi:hypothetical protein